MAATLVGLSGMSQAWAVSIGDIEVRSRLGQPLDAVVHVSAAPGETLRADCFRTVNAGDAALPPITNVRLSLSSRLSGGAALHLRGRETLREPMSELILKVECEGTPQMTRTFLVLLDPPVDAELRSDRPATERVVQTAPRADVAPVAAPTAVADIYSESPRVRVQPSYLGPNDPIRPGSLYTVQRGDVLSVIAARVSGRGEYTVWPIAERILADNPQAFENGDPNLLEIGARIAIPALENGALAERIATAPPAAMSATSVARNTSQQRATLSIPAPTAPAPEPVRSSVATRAALRPVPVGNVVTTAPTMVLSQRLSGISRERLRLRRSGKIQVLQSAVIEAPPEPQQPSQPNAPIAPASVPLETVARTEFQRSKGFAGGLMGWILLVLGIFLGVIGTAFGLRNATRRRIEDEVAARLKADQYQVELDRNRQSRETVRPEDRIIVDEVPGRATPQPAQPAQLEIEEEAPTRDNIEQQIQELAPKEEPAILDEVVSEEADSEDDFEFELFEEPNALDLELLARDYAETVYDVRNLEKVDENSQEPMLEASELGLVPEGTEIMSTGLDLELPAEETQNSEYYRIASKDEETSEMQLDSDPTSPSPVLPPPTSATMEIDAGLLQLTETQTDVEPLREAPDNPAPSDAPLPVSGDSQEFYHLEASSIMPADELQFEADRDADESKVLEFRHPGRTGTDDSAAES